MQIELKNLRKTYKGPTQDVTAVDGISLSISGSTIFGIIGKSGAGKSSLVRLMSLLERPDEGEVYYDGVRVDSLPKKELIEQRRKTGMIFQNFNLFSSRTAAKNVAYPLEIRGMSKQDIRARVGEMLSLVGLEDKAASPISALSGGQKQRIAIARALAPRPDVLFCDEATSALDPQTTSSILDLIRDIQKQMGLTVVMITHQMEVVRDACDRVAVIDAGRVIEQGDVRDVFSRPEQPLTREFMRMMSPSESGKRFARWSDEGGAYELRFPKDLTGAPVLSRLSKLFNVEFNIRAAGVESRDGGDVGTMILDLYGDDAEVAKAVEYLRNEGIGVKRAQHEAARGAPDVQRGEVQ